jgi:hypothetical protein
VGAWRCGGIRPYVVADDDAPGWGRGAAIVGANKNGAYRAPEFARTCVVGAW